MYPNDIIPFQIVLTSTITTAIPERSYSKLRMIKTTRESRSTISQGRFTSVSVLSIKNYIAKKFDYDDVILEFSRKRARVLTY